MKKIIYIFTIMFFTVTFYFGIGACTKSSPVLETPNRDVNILVYHRIGDTTDPLTVSTAEFEKQIKTIIDNGYSIITLDEFRTFMNDKGIILPEKPVLITFDDGYEDNYLNAYPVLQKYNVSGTIFMVTDSIGKKDRLSAEEIKTMSQNKMFFGSHSKTHRKLTSLSPEELSTEMVESKKALENVIEKKVYAIAYPEGSFNESTLEATEKAGYDIGFTIESGSVDKGTQDERLSRKAVFRWDKDILKKLKQ